MIVSSIIQRASLLILLSVVPLSLYCQQDRVFALQNNTACRIELDTIIHDNCQLECFTSESPISGLAFSGEITLYSDSSMVRIILMDGNYNEYLIYEAYPILSGSGKFSVFEAAEETALLNNITPVRISLEFMNSSAHIQEFIVSEAGSYQAAAKSVKLHQQTLSKIHKINQNIQRTGQIWRAGETSISRLSYQEKKSMFGGRIPNFQGFEYYKGGVFVLPGYSGNEPEVEGGLSTSRSQEASTYPDEFSWQNMHGINWVTPVRNQGPCGSCTAFGITAAVELLVNLYYNQTLDYDLSEQQILSCIGSCEYGVQIWEALDYMMNTGIVPEDCFPYTASDSDCSEICNNSSERIRIEKWKTVNSSEENKKRAIIQGATCGFITSWEHLAQVTGYKTLEARDVFYAKNGNDSIVGITLEENSPLIGEKAWIIKNSWGTDWGTDGFGYVVGNNALVLYSLHGPLSSLLLNEANIACNDKDGDGFYSWGIGSKPSHCPDCPDQADGDDSDPCWGPMDDYGNLLSVTPAPQARDTIILYGSPPELYVEGMNIQWYDDQELENLVHSGNLFPTGQTDPGTYTYYVTQTVSACESQAKDISLSLVTAILPPVGQDTTIDIGEPAILSVAGEQGAVFKWYEDPLLTNLRATGDSFLTGMTNTGVYTYYVTQTLCLIESSPDTVSLKITELVKFIDDLFFNALIMEGMDQDGDHKISTAEAVSVDSLNIISYNITDISGIEAFENLEFLDCTGNQLSSLDISRNTELLVLRCSYNLLKSLDVERNTKLTELSCYGNDLSSLDVSTNTSLKTLEIGLPVGWGYDGNNIDYLDLSKNKDLAHLDCTGNPLTGLDLTSNTHLKYVQCINSQLASLDVSGCTSLEELSCDWNMLTSMDVSACTALEKLSCDWNLLTSLNLSECKALTNINCSGNMLNSLDVSGCNALKNLNCDWNLLTSLNLSGCKALTNMNCSGNMLTSLDASYCIELEELLCEWNRLTALDISECTALRDLDCDGNYLSSLDISGTRKLKILSCSGNMLNSLDVSGNFKLKELWCNNNLLTFLKISDTISLEWLWCGQNKLSSLDVSGNTALESLYCSDNQLISLYASGCSALKELWCEHNKLTSLDVSGNTALESLSFSDNHLISLDVSGCVRLRVLSFEGNPLESLNASYCKSLWRLNLENGHLTSLNVSNCSRLNRLVCNNNKLVDLKISNNPSLKLMNCYGNQLTSLDLTGCTILGSLDCSGNKLTSLSLCSNPGVGTLKLDSMPTLQTVFLPSRSLNLFEIDTSGSQNVKFIQCGVGIEENITAGLTIYPNPANNLLNVETGVSGNYTIVITSLNGIELYRKETHGSSHQIDLSSFQKGVYFITIRSKDFVTTRKIIKL